MDAIQIVAKIKFETFQELGLWVARTPALRLSANGASKAEALQNLQELLGEFFVSCIERGNILDVLKAHQVDAVSSVRGGDPEEFVEVPIPLLAADDARRQIR